MRCGCERAVCVPKAPVRLRCGAVSGLRSKGRGVAADFCVVQSDNSKAGLSRRRKAEGPVRGIARLPKML